MRIRKLTEQQFRELKQKFDNGEWLTAAKYGLNYLTVKRIKKSRTYQDYIGKNGKHGIAEPPVS